MNKSQLIVVRHTTLPLLPGTLFCLMVVFAAKHIADHYGSPLILSTVLLGMAFNTLSKQNEFLVGLDFCAKTILRIGVALLGIRITFAQISELGAAPLLLVGVAVSGTILFSLLAAHLLKIDRLMAIVTGIAVSICGVSAALAVLAVMPTKRLPEKQVVCTLVGVTGISTVAMILYPALVTKLGLSVEQMGLFLGVSIHDVAQAIGAGEMISPAVADVTIYTKMLRVALLVPILFIVSFAFRADKHTSGKLSGKIPLFLIAFVLIMVVANLQLLPMAVTQSVSTVSQFCLLMAMAALGTKTNLVELFSINKKPLALVALNTIFLATLSLLIIFYLI